MHFEKCKVQTVEGYCFSFFFLPLSSFNAWVAADAFLEQLRKEIDSTEEEDMKISNEIDDLTRTLTAGMSFRIIYS